MRARSSLIPSTSSGQALQPSSLFRRGYSFTEVMFAVVVLGIGFIMVAAMFPVALSQQQSTQQETNAAAIARAAANYFESVATSAMLPGTGADRPLVVSIRNPQSSNPPVNLPAGELLWNALKGNLIVAGDQRYGIVMMYRREGVGVNAQRRVQLIVVVTQVRNRSTYDAGDVYSTPAPTAPQGYNLQARPVEVDIDGAQQAIEFTGGQVGSVAEGSYVVISDDNLTAPNEGVMNGYIYRVGSHLGGNRWQLAPGNDFAPFDPDGSGPIAAITGLSGANAFVVGRNTTATAGVYDGPAQDIAVYTTFIQVR